MARVPFERGRSRTVHNVPRKFSMFAMTNGSLSCRDCGVQVGVVRYIHYAAVGGIYTRSKAGVAWMCSFGLDKRPAWIAVCCQRV